MFDRLDALLGGGHVEVHRPAEGVTEGAPAAAPAPTYASGARILSIGIATTGVVTLAYFVLAAQAHGLTHVVRVGGDDPLIDPDCCTALVRLHEESGGDFLYASNRDGWPYGCAAELVAVAALERIHAATAEPPYLEHTIPYFFHHPEEFSIRRVESPAAVRRPELAFTVDYPEDLELVRAVFRELAAEGDYFPLRSVIRLMDERPELRMINAHLHTGFDR